MLTKTAVLICTYNGESYIEKQLLSIINQTVRVDKIFIRDDRSSDNTLLVCRNVLEGIIDYEIEINNENIGYKKNFLGGISKLSKTNFSYIYLSDQDDEWELNKVEKLNEILTSHDLVFTDLSIVDTEGHTLGYTKYNEMGFSSNQFNKLHNDDKLNMLLSRNYATGASIALKNSDILTSLEHIYVDLPHDYLLVLMFTSNDRKVYSYSKSLVRYRQHDRNLIGAKRNGYIKKATFALNGMRINLANQAIDLISILDTVILNTRHNHLVLQHIKHVYSRLFRKEIKLNNYFTFSRGTRTIISDILMWSANR